MGEGVGVGGGKEGDVVVEGGGVVTGFEAESAESGGVGEESVTSRPADFCGGEAIWSVLLKNGESGSGVRAVEEEGELAGDSKVGDVIDFWWGGVFEEGGDPF